MSQKAIVFEINEIPLRIFRRFQELAPGSNIDRLMRSSLVLETLAQDVEPEVLYPSQTWASLNTGVPYGTHKIHWYNDPKPEEYPLYWKLLADRGLSIGTVNTLHSSPAKSFADGNPNFKFVIPDCFASDTYTKPTYYEPFQTLNVKAVNSNLRATQMKAPFREAALTVLNSPRYGIRTKTLVEGAALVTKILAKQINRERLRNYQFPLVADVFFKLFDQHQPDLAILFTNHVAANMHRYWYALFPQDYQDKAYQDGWVAKYRDEIIAAVKLLDAYMGRMMALAEKTGRVLIVVSSMGQKANLDLNSKVVRENSIAYVLKDPGLFLSKLTGKKYNFKQDSAMFPQYSLEFATEEEARQCHQDATAAVATSEGFLPELDLNGRILTLSIRVYPVHFHKLKFRGQAAEHTDSGFSTVEIDDHHSGHHCPEGSLLVFNSKTAKASKKSVDYLEYTPALLQLYGVEPKPYMVKPTFSF